MNRFFFDFAKLACLTVVVLALGCPVAVFAKYVAVLETVSPNNKLLTIEERQYLTDVLRSQAVKSLPAEQNFTIMTRENINVMLPPGKSIEDCEGSCLAETGKNIAADYVAQARITEFGGSLAISAEVYETAGNKLLASFNGRGNSVTELEQIIKDESPEFFKKVKGGNTGWGGVAGFGNFSTGGDFAVQGVQSFIMEVSSEPAGASLSIDGRPITKCTSTPCRVQVEVGEHRFLLVKDQYEDADTLFTVSAESKVLRMKLEPNFGSIYINPLMPGNLGNPRNLRINVDGEPLNGHSRNIAPGVHKVTVTHPCYDPLEFSVGIEKGKTSSYTEPLKRGVGGLKLTALWNGEPQPVGVFVDGKEVGSTPFLGTVPLCATVAVGEGYTREAVAVELKWHETVEYEHVLKNAPMAVATSTAADTAREKAHKAYAELDGNPWNEQPAGESVPTNIEEEDGGIHWVPVGISAAVLVAGTVLAIVGNSQAKDTYDSGVSDADEYHKAKDDIHSAQTMRTVGIGIAIAGAVGLGLSFAF
ncbi:MAG: PEGA domain-containing protein [Fibrobacter sp.]|nr:PEGA domain-containing protein [Fibrobacter sp.]